MLPGIMSISIAIQDTRVLPDRSSGGFGFGRMRLDPFPDARFTEEIMRLQKLRDFYQGAMHDRIGERRAEKGRLELEALLKILRPFAAYLGKSKIQHRP
jgi:hypothetical protein